MDARNELLHLTQRLLDCIVGGDWATYAEFCDPSLTALEPEAKGQVVEGLDFHRFYFDLGGVKGPHRTTICSPNVRLMGDVAIVAYARLVQSIGPEGTPVTTASQETRIWHKQPSGWRLVHFHRSAL